MNADTLPPFSLPSSLPRSRRKRPGVGLFIGLSVVVAFVLFGSILGAYFLLHPVVPSSLPPFSGQAFIISSAQWDVSSTQGDNDKLQIELHNMPAPASDKTYYAWLLSDDD